MSRARQGTLGSDNRHVNQRLISGTRIAEVGIQGVTVKEKTAQLICNVLPHRALEEQRCCIVHTPGERYRNSLVR